MTDKNETVTNVQDTITKLTATMDDETLRKMLQKISKARRKDKGPTKKVPTAPHTVSEFIRWFTAAPDDQLYNVKRGQWECCLGNVKKQTAHTLQFHSALLKGEECDKASDIVMLRTTAPDSLRVPIFNASSLTYGTTHDPQKLPQELAEKHGAVPVPFETVVAAAKLDLSKLRVLDWGKSERLLVPPANYPNTASPFQIINRHFAGAVLLQIENTYFLFDTDREELKYHNFNPFFTQLPAPVTTIAEAYDILMPSQVKEAKAAGTEVLRQGEYFFVAVSDAEVLAVCRAHTKHPQTYLDVVVPHIFQTADYIAAKQINGDKAARQVTVEVWLREYKLKIEDEGTHIKQASNAVAGYLAYLRQQVGCDAAKLRKDELRNFDHNRLWQYNRTMEEEYAELRMRLRERTGVDADVSLHVDRILQTTAKDAGDDVRATRSNGHTITLMCIGPDDPTRCYARGVVHHTGRQHHDLYLPGWYRIYANTATANYTVHGSVD